MFAFRLVLLLFLFVTLVFSKDSIDSEDYTVSEDEDIEVDQQEAVYNKTYFEKLDGIHRELLGKYDKHSRPVKNGSVPTNVTVFWRITHVSIDTQDQSMRLTGHFYMSWIDELLGWDPEKHHGIKQIQFERWQLWRPPLRMLNSFRATFGWFEFMSNTHVTASTLGKDAGALIQTFPTFNVRISCSFDFAAFPNDINSCALKLFAEAPMSEIELHFFPTSDAESLRLAWGEDKKTIISDFDLIKIESRKYYFGLGENMTDIAPVISTEYPKYYSILFTDITFMRHSPLFFAGIAMPCVLCATLNTLSFLIPTVQFAAYTLMSSMFIQLVFLKDVFNKVPSSMSTIPPCIRLYSLIMIITILSLAFHFVLLILMNCQKPVPETMNMITVVRKYLPESWMIQKENTKNSWTTWIATIRPLIAILLAIVYLIAFCTLVVFV